MTKVLNTGKRGAKAGMKKATKVNNLLECSVKERWATRYTNVYLSYLVQSTDFPPTDAKQGEIEITR